jgi:subtilisin family serine protease
MAVTSNPKVRGMAFLLVVALTVLCTAPAGKTTAIDAGREYVLTVGGEELRFVARPELGYVVKTQQDTSSVGALAGMLKSVGAADISPIGGSGRKGICVVHNERPADENRKTVRLLGAYKQVQYAAPLFSSNGETVAIIPEIVVRVKPGTRLGQLRAFCEKTGCRIKKRMEFTEQEYLLEVLGPDADAVFAAVEQLGQAPCVEWACPNTASQPKLCGQAVSGGGPSAEQLWINTPGVFPNDEYFPMQWHLHNTGQSGGTPGVDIRAPEAWEITTGDPNIVVAEFGGYVDTNHPDLVNNLVPGYDFVQPGSTPVFDNLSAGHSTWCAGIVASQGNNGIGVTGVTWSCKVMPIRIWRDVPLPVAHIDVTEAERATAIRWAAANGADVLDCQLGFGTQQLELQSALADVTRSGGLGRDGKGCVAVFWGAWYPGRYPEVIAVESVDHNGNLFSVNYHGPELDIVAPDWLQLREEEGGLWTTDVMGLLGMSSHQMHPDPNVLDYSIADGASSIVAGVAALILSVEPNLTSDEVRHFLERSAKDLGDPGRDDYYGWGRVDARAALDMVLAARADLHRDGKVDFRDLAVLNAAIDLNDLSADIAPAAKRDGIVDEKDLELLTRYLGTQYPELGLIAHFKLDETGGSTAHESINGSDDMVMGNPLWQPTGGQVDGALELDGVDDCIISTSGPNPAQGPLSLIVWIKGGAPGQVIISQPAGANWLLTDAGGRLMTELKGPGRSDGPLLSQTIITDGQWHRVALTWDGSYRTLCVDGVVVAQDTQSSLEACAGGLYIGVGKDYAPGTFFSGLIDDVRIYNRAVTP